MIDAPTPSGDGQTPYRVLARAYRPQRLSELVGQDALVRTLTNAMATGRIAHAFLLCGIRGVGKTTTARIIAKGLNCVGPDGQGGPTPEPCGVCPPCQAIGAERSLDVLEMDAASHTGKDDVLELIEGVRYGPSAARYKVYVVDEIHMLSEKAFNALLKTIEEPPPHAKFIFATTEARKVPVTVLSRCQRFDLRRVEPDVLQGHLASICVKEAVEADDEALGLIARAAEGSVRDSLSLLDQGIAISAGKVEAAAVASMLGLGDRSKILALFDHLMAGRAREALGEFRDLWARGAEPASVLQDLLEVAHWLSCLKLDREAPSSYGARPELAEQGQSMAAASDVAVLGRAWQVLLKGLDELRTAPDAKAAAEMVLLRLASMGQLPPPGEIAKLLRQNGLSVQAPAAHASPPPAPPRTFHQAAPPAAAPTPRPASQPQANGTLHRPALSQVNGAARHAPAAAAPPIPRSEPESPDAPADFKGLAEALGGHASPRLAAELRTGVHLVAYDPVSDPPKLEIRLEPTTTQDFPNRLNAALRGVFGRAWAVTLSSKEGAPTLAEAERAENEAMLGSLKDDPQIRAILDTYPGTELVEVRKRNQPAAAQPTKPTRH